jgi:hypothetical protein
MAGLTWSAFAQAVDASLQLWHPHSWDLQAAFEPAIITMKFSLKWVRVVGSPSSDQL